MILVYDNDQWQTYEPGSEMKEIFFTSYVMHSCSRRTQHLGVRCGKSE